MWLFSSLGQPDDPTPLHPYFRREVDRGNVVPHQISGQGARCVRRRAELSVSMHRQCGNMESARAAVERAGQSCFHDTAPFDEHATRYY